MNDIHSHHELKYHPRWLASEIRQAVQYHPVVVISGARQVGKSTMLQNEDPFNQWLYLTLDNFDILDQANRDAQALWSGTRQIIIDEVQKSPRLLAAVKQSVDSNPDRYRFILSGSTNLLIMKQVSESLAGRAVYFDLLPMTISEIYNTPRSNILSGLLSGKQPTKSGKSESVDPLPFLWKGLLPTLLRYDLSPQVVRWWEGYVLTYLERDLRQLTQIDSLTDYRRLMTALALRCGQLINQSEVSRDTTISQPTVHRYMNLLEATHILYRLPAFAVNRTKRLIKSPKLMWMDPGLVCFLSGLFTVTDLNESNQKGRIFESMIFNHLYAFSQIYTPKFNIFYWRTSNGKEVDFVLELGKKLVAIEVKMTDIPRFVDIQNLKLFMAEYPETEASVLVYAGSTIRQMDENIFAVPWNRLI